MRARHPIAPQHTPDAARSAARSDSASTVIVALTVNLAVAVAKAVAAAITGSTAMLAEAAHSFADTGNEVLLLVADRRASRPATPEHPLGFGRDSYFWALLASIGVFLTGALLSGREGVEQLLHPTNAVHTRAALVVLAIAFALELVSFLRAYRQLHAEARSHSRAVVEHIVLTSDPTARAVLAEDAAALVGNVIAAAGLVLHRLTGSTVPDGLAAIAVGVLLAVVGFHLASRNRDFLIGEQAPRAIRERVRDTILTEPGVLEVHDLILSFIGPRQLWAIARVHVDPATPVRDLEAIARRIELALHQTSAFIVRVDIVVDSRSAVDV